MENDTNRYNTSSVSDYSDARSRIEAQIRANTQARLNAQANSRPSVKATAQTDDIDELLASLNLNETNSNTRQSAAPTRTRVVNNVQPDESQSQTQVISRAQMNAALGGTSSRVRTVSADSPAQSSRVRSVSADGAVQNSSRVRAVSADGSAQTSSRVRSVSADGTAQTSSRVRSVSADGTAQTSSRVRTVSADGTAQTSSRVRSVSADGTAQTSSRVRSVSADASSETPRRRNVSQVDPSQARVQRVATGVRGTSNASAASENRRPSTQMRTTAPSGTRRVSNVSNVNSDDEFAIVKREKKEVGRTRTSVNKNAVGKASARRTRAIAEQENSDMPPIERTVKKKGFKGFGKFGKFLVIYAAIWLVIIIVGGIIFNSFLAKSESYQPVHIIETIVEKFKSSDDLSAFLQQYTSIVIRPDGADSDESFVSSLSGKEISFIEDSSKSTTTTSTYKIKADGTTVSTIELAMNGTGDFGLDKWGLASVDITEGFPDLITYNILVPEGSTVTMNGQVLGENKITATGTPEVLVNSVQYMSNPPEMITYTTKLMPNITPEVSATDSTGNPLTFTASETGYVAVPNASQEFIDSVNPLVEAAIKEWATYFIHMSFNLEPYILEGCDLYVSIFGSDEMDPILTWLYNFEYIVDYEFTELSASNYVVYSDDCFTVDVKYNLAITFDREGVEDNNQNLDATWVFVRDGDSWSICDMIYH